MRGDGWRVAFIGLGVVALITGSLSGRAADVPAPVRVPMGAPASGDTMDGTVTVEVERGDHLWKISSRRLDAVLGREPADEEVSPYWRTVIEVNRHGLRSGDPDLIYPGEMVTLPGAG